MSATCDNCGSSEFRDMEHDYYGMCWRATCDGCGNTLVIKEAE